MIWIAQVGTQSLTLSFPPLSDFGTSRACHTLAIVPFFAGDIYGPYLPEGHKNGIGKENVNENGSNELSVPQLLGMGNPTWHCLPDSPAPDLPDGRDTLSIGSRVYSLRSGKKVSSSSAKIVSSSASSPIKEETLSSSSLASESELSLLSYICSGRLWDTFRGLLSPSQRPVAVKTTCPIVFPSKPSEEWYSEAQARRAISREDLIYRRLLPALGGKVVARYYGLWGGVLPLQSRWKAEREMWVMVMEDCGPGVDVDALSRRDR